MNGCHSAPGSPVLNRKGELLGVINGKFKNKTQIIPSEYFKGLESGSQIIKPYLGLTLKTSDEGGAFIIKINSDSPAEKAGLRLGEVIKSIDGVPIQHGKDVTKMLGLTKHVQFHQFEISRDGRLRTVNVYLS